MRLLGGGGTFSPGSLFEAVVFLALGSLVSLGVVATVLAFPPPLGGFGSFGGTLIGAVF